MILLWNDFMIKKMIIVNFVIIVHIILLNDYIWIIIIMFALLNLHIRNRLNDRKIAAIVREIALAKPRKPDDENDH